MWLRVLVGAFVVLFCLMYWQAPGAPMRASVANNQMRDEWQKLRQEIRSHQERFAQSAPIRSPIAYRNLDSQSIPQLTKAYAETTAMPKQGGEMEAAGQSLSDPLNVRDFRPPDAPRKRVAARKRAQPKRLVRVAIYEDGRTVGMRTFEVGGRRRGRTHRRCPSDKCSLSAALFGSGGFN
jgi:hypothetical protein